jgi:photosystem II stability/assembly factor-like uncharacterized protein
MRAALARCAAPFVLLVLVGFTVLDGRFAPAKAVVEARQTAALTPDLLSGLTLRNIGPANMSGRIVDLAVVESDTSIIYAASATGGLWKTTDNGITFAPVFEDQPVHSIGAIALSQSNPQIVWVGTGERANRQSSSWGDGVYKSTDAGKTWTNMGLRDTLHIGRILLHPANPDTVYVAAPGHLWGPNKERGLFKSTDGGRTWRNVLFVDEDTGVIDVAMDPADPDTLYAAAYQRRRQPYGFHGGGPGSGLRKSTDGGETWRPLTKGLPSGEMGRIGISVYRKDPRIVYVSVEQGFRYNASTAYIERRAGVYRSEDKGESWQHMSDWNPRPMYASQILVDPSDDKRIYMVNAYSFSDDGGKTFTVPRQTLHGDDRIVWVNPTNSKHVLKGDDGGLGISYDRGLKWLYVSSLPVSQYYRVALDMRKPYWVYGGLQDNGCWAGPSATYFSSGILNEDWFRTCGGDGFRSIPDPNDERTVYSTSQFLGLSRVDLVTRESRSIRPDQPRGFIQARRNWETWGRPGAEEATLGNAMPPANWDAPFILSPHDTKTIYAGTNVLWKSTDRGDSWTSLGTMTTGVDRSTLKIMGQAPNEHTLSLDDGVPYYPSLTAIAESPLRKGLLYVGTDDGNLKISRDEGKSWTELASRLPGLPRSSWISGIEASKHAEGTVYVSADNHARDDYRNYLYRSPDHGATWESITGDLPANRVIRAVHEDPRNPSLVYAGTEFGFFLSPDVGKRWVELRGNMPRLPINDFAIHPRDNDLVLATHGRGIWILDNLNALQELTPAVMTSEAHLFDIDPAEMIRYSNPKAHAGDMIFRGENPPAGAIVDYFVGAKAADVALSVHDATGAEIRRLEPAKARGVNRVIWDLRYPPLAAAPGGDEEGGGGRRRGLPGPFVVPGTYTVRLQAAGRTMEKKVEVREDPRIVISPEERRRWTETLLQVADIYKVAAANVQALAKSTGGKATTPAQKSLQFTVGEFQSRVATLYSNLSGSTASPTADQRSQIAYYGTLAKELAAKVGSGSDAAR